jgi:hypothetical protein
MFFTIHSVITPGAQYRMTSIPDKSPQNKPFTEGTEQSKSKRTRKKKARKKKRRLIMRTGGKTARTGKKKIRNTLESVATTTELSAWV